MENLWMIFNEDTNISASKKYYLESAEKNKVQYSIKYIELFKIDGDELYYDKKIIVNLPAVVLFRFRHEIEFELYKYLEKNNKRIINNCFCLHNCNDKLITYELLEQHRIKQPKTLPFGDGINYAELAEKLGNEFVAKDRFGQMGIGVFLITNEEEFAEAIKSVKKENLIFQEYIKESFGKDLRVYVIGNTVAGAVLRSGGTDFRSNVYLGAVPSLYELTDEQKKLAIKVAKAICGEIISVDFLIKNDELLFCEANSNAGLVYFEELGLEGTGSIPNADVIMKYVSEVIETELEHKEQDLWMIYERDEVPANFTKYFDKYDLSYEIKPIWEFKIKNGKLYYQEELVKSLPKVVLFRFREEEIEFELCKYFEKNGVRVVNNYFCLYNCNDKISTYRLLKKFRVKQPRTLFYCKAVTYEEIAKIIGKQFVVKDRLGQNGVDVFLVNNADEFDVAVSSIDEDKIIYQEYIKESFGKDLRTYVVGNEVVGAILREGSKDFRSNINQGAKPYKYDLSEEEKALSLKIAKAINSEIVSVDFLFRGEELVLCETNSNAGILSFVKLGIPVAEEIVKYIVDVVKRCN